MTDKFSEKPEEGPPRDDEVENADNTKNLAVEAAAKGQGVSGYETLSLWETVKTFKVNTTYCYLVPFSAVADGYQIGINANITANPGFVRQFATATSDEGEAVLAS